MPNLGDSSHVMTASQDMIFLQKPHKNRDKNICNWMEFIVNINIILDMTVLWITEFTFLMRQIKKMV